MVAVFPLPVDMSVTITHTMLPALLYVHVPFSLVASVTSDDWDTDYCLWPRTLRIAIMSEMLELPFATSPAILSLPNFLVLIVAPWISTVRDLMNHPSGPTTVVLKVAYIDVATSSIGTVTEPKVSSVSWYMIVILAKPATLCESVTLSLSLGLPSKRIVGDTDY